MALQEDAHNLIGGDFNFTMSSGDRICNDTAQTGAQRTKCGHNPNKRTQTLATSSLLLTSSFGMVTDRDAVVTSTTANP